MAEPSAARSVARRAPAGSAVAMARAGLAAVPPVARRSFTKLAIGNPLES